MRVRSRSPLRLDRKAVTIPLRLALILLLALGIGCGDADVEPVSERAGTPPDTGRRIEATPSETDPTATAEPEDPTETEAEVAAEPSAADTTGAPTAPPPSRTWAPAPPGGYAVDSRPAGEGRLARIEYASPKTVSELAEFYDRRIDATRRLEILTADGSVVAWGLS
ncbi:MAG: hypothetical protein R3199_12635, partial [Gemmatimonadota bacterium]|nr:hypothetical protein [Gemmatimonadota bacterium]